MTGSEVRRVTEQSVEAWKAMRVPFEYVLHEMGAFEGTEKWPLWRV